MLDKCLLKFNVFSTSIPISYLTSSKNYFLVQLDSRLRSTLEMTPVTSSLFVDLKLSPPAALSNNLPSLSSLSSLFSCSNFLVPRAVRHSRSFGQQSSIESSTACLQLVILSGQPKEAIKPASDYIQSPPISIQKPKTYSNKYETGIGSSNSSDL